MFDLSGASEPRWLFHWATETSDDPPGCPKMPPWAESAAVFSQDSVGSTGGRGQEMYFCIIRSKVTFRVLVFNLGIFLLSCWGHLWGHYFKILWWAEESLQQRLSLLFYPKQKGAFYWTVLLYYIMLHGVNNPAHELTHGIASLSIKQQLSVILHCSINRNSEESRNNNATLF